MERGGQVQPPPVRQLDGPTPWDPESTRRDHHCLPDIQLGNTGMGLGSKQRTITHCILFLLLFTFVRKTNVLWEIFVYILNFYNHWWKYMFLSLWSKTVSLQVFLGDGEEEKWCLALRVTQTRRLIKDFWSVVWKNEWIGDCWMSIFFFFWVVVADSVWAAFSVAFFYISEEVDLF